MACPIPLAYSKKEDIMKVKIKDVKSGLGLNKEEEEYFNNILNINEDEEIELDELLDETNDMEDTALADSMTNSYTSELLKWYGEDLHRVEYMTEAITELGANDGFSALSGGQYLYHRERINEAQHKIITYLEELLDQVATCLECGEEYLDERDIQLCDKCVNKFDLDKLFNDHDSKKIDALDFNEQKNIREQYRK